jgi:hypothetical protein
LISIVQGDNRLLSLSDRPSTFTTFVDHLELASTYPLHVCVTGGAIGPSPLALLAFDHDLFDQSILLLEAAYAIRYVAYGMKGYHLTLTDGKDARTPSKATGKQEPSGRMERFRDASWNANNARPLRA